MKRAAKKRSVLILGCVGTLAVGIAWWHYSTPPARKQAFTSMPVGARTSKEAREAAQTLRDITQRTARSSPKKALQTYEAFVIRHKQSTDARVQDEVASARMRMGHIAGKTKDFTTARSYFQQAAHQYRGTGGMDPSFGSLPDQAAYQAAVCLAAEGKRKEAVAGFRSFMKDRKSSPLVHAAYRRLVGLTGGDPNGEYEAMLQKAVTYQEKRAEIAQAMCGPKCLEYLLSLLGKKHENFEALAKQSGTGPDGTTLAALAATLKKHGVTTWGARVAGRDFRRITSPAIWLIGGHYVVLLETSGRRCKVYDPLYKLERYEEIPDNEEFAATMLLLHPLEDTEVAE